MDDDFVKELVWSLKPEFQEKKFSEVEKALKDKFTREIESLNAKWQVERLDKLKVEREVEKLKDLNSRLIKERNDDKNLIVELQKKIGDLGCEKLRAESDLEVFKKRFEELETRIERLQNELELLNAGEEQVGLMNARVSEETNHLQEKFLPQVKTEVDANGDKHFESLEQGDNTGKKKTSGSEEVDSVPNCEERNEIPVEKVMTGKNKTSGNEKVESVPNRGKNNEIPPEKVDQIGSLYITSMNNAGTQKKVIEVDAGGRNDGIFRNGSEPNEGTASCRMVDTKGGKKKPSGSEEIDGGGNHGKNNEISVEKLDEIGSLNIDTIMDNAGTREKKVIEVDVYCRKKRIVTKDSELNEVTGSRKTVDKKGGIRRPSTEIINIDSDDDDSSRCCMETKTVKRRNGETETGKRRFSKFPLCLQVSEKEVSVSETFPKCESLGDQKFSSPKSTNVQETVEKLLKRKRFPAELAQLGYVDSSSSSESEDEPDLSFDLQSMMKILKKKV